MKNENTSHQHTAPLRKTHGVKTHIAQDFAAFENHVFHSVSLHIFTQCTAGSMHMQIHILSRTRPRSHSSPPACASQPQRRMIHDGVRRGFTAWKELFSSKIYAIHMLQRTAHRLGTAELRSSFVSWKVSVP